MFNNSNYYYVPKDIIINKKDWDKCKNKYEIKIYIPQIIKANWIIVDEMDNIICLDTKIMNENVIMLESDERLKVILQYQYKTYASPKEYKCEREEINKEYQNAIKRLELTVNEFVETLNKIKSKK